ncbi:MAG: hypothetical protein RLZZ324_11, partial [Candidatus Parcubacteria bacterium]
MTRKTYHVRSPRVVRPKKPRPVAVFDLDGTLVREQLLVLLTKEFFELGIFRPIVERIFKEVRLKHRDRKISFEEYDGQIIDIYSESVRGKLRKHVQFAAKNVFDKHRDWLYRFTKALIEEVTATHERITITGAMHETVSLLAPYWGMEHAYCTELETDDAGRYDGRYRALPVKDKKAALLAHLKKTDATLEGSVAIGDTLSDAPVLRSVVIPIVFNPDDKLADIADECGWPIVVERKDCIYVMQRGRCKRFSATDARP